MSRKREVVHLIKQKKKIDFVIISLVIGFCLFGLIMIYEASNIMALRNFGDKYFFIKDQILWIVIGLLCMFLVSKIHYKKYYYMSVPLIFVSILTLIAVFIPGIGKKLLGAKRWISLGIFNFQPSEFVKLSIILYLSSWLSTPEKKRFTAFLLLFFLIVGLVILQPDLGTAFILTVIFIVSYFLSGATLWHFIVLIPVSIIAVLGLAVSSPYRLRRIMTFLNPNFDPMGSSYHIRQILISFGSGGLWGLGIGASRQKYLYLPEATTDSIFAIIGEELGYIGAVFFIIVFLILLIRIYRIVKLAPDKHSFLLSGGILTYLSIQTIINLGSMVAIFPLTGVPLPFISYGGSNLIVTLMAIGIVLNINKYIVDKK